MLGRERLPAGYVYAPYTAVNQSGSNGWFKWARAYWNIVPNPNGPAAAKLYKWRLVGALPLLVAAAAAAPVLMAD
jgi:hypothetical protein